MKRKLMIAALGAALFSAAAWAQWGPGMGGYGYQGMGPGMMGGYGSSYGMGPGMMGGYGGQYGMGPGMMGGYGWRGYDALDLTDEQRDKIAAIQKDLSSKRWGVMTAMHELRWNSFGPGAAKDADPRKTYDAMAALRKQMFEATLDADKRIEAVLTKEQKDQLGKERRRGW